MESKELSYIYLSTYTAGLVFIAICVLAVMSILSRSTKTMVPEAPVISSEKPYIISPVPRAAKRVMWDTEPLKPTKKVERPDDPINPGDSTSSEKKIILIYDPNDPVTAEQFSLIKNDMYRFKFYPVDSPEGSAILFKEDLTADDLRGSIYFGAGYTFRGKPLSYLQIRDIVDRGYFVNDGHATFNFRTREYQRLHCGYSGSCKMPAPEPTQLEKSKKFSSGSDDDPFLFLEGISTSGSKTAGSLDRNSEYMHLGVGANSA